MLPVEEVDSATASSVDQSSDNSFSANDSDVDLGEPLDADAFNGLADNETPTVNIGEPLDANSTSTDYTYETPVDLGEPMDANNPSLSNIDEPSEYQNIGPDMTPGEENLWIYDEPRNIGPVMAADELVPN
ncbi:hypothetical protein N9S00_04535 [Luminiphilus sp.]|nr:hypothetical protein [Luminiphilus sp.]